MKKYLLLISILMFNLISCGIQKNNQVDVSQENTLPETLIIGLDDTFAPMGFRNEKGEIVGFDIDLANAVGEKLGIKFEFKPINWDAKILDLNSGNIDLIWNGLTITPDRAEETEMSKPYYYSSQSITVLKDAPVKSIEDLYGKVVGVQSQSSGEEAIIKAGDDKKFKELKTYAQYDQAFLDLENGRIDAIIVDETFAKYIAKTKENQTGKQLYDIYDSNYGTEEAGIAAKKGRKFLIEQIENALDELRSEGVYDEISNKWFSN